MNSTIGKIKIIFIDIDGTLCNTKKQVTEYTKSILGKAKDMGIYIVLCSGRSNESVCEESKNINASRYVISNNGAYVYNYVDDIEIFESVMNKEILQKMWNICEEEEKWELMIEVKERVYINKLTFRQGVCKYKEINNIKDILDQKVFQIVINIYENKGSNKIREILSNEEKIWAPNYGKGIVSDNFFDINNKNIDKGMGIKHLIKHLGIKKEEAIGFGDGINDCVMFRECGIGVAMGNAVDELKNIADYITLTNDEDGVAKFIEKYILHE